MLALSALTAALVGALAAIEVSAVPLSKTNPSLASVMVPRATNESSTVAVVDFPIHSSCNASQKKQLQGGLFDLKRVTRAAADHLLLHGNSSALFVTYFGQAGDPAVPLGIYERILNGDKSTALLRCDDPDHNCATQVGWNGHWRGNNATEETVICPLSFETRLPIEKLCANGFRLAHDDVNIYWALDLMHRAMHLPSLTNGHVSHTADKYMDTLTLAKQQPGKAGKNQHTLQEFAFEVFSRAHTGPQGCVGLEDKGHDDSPHTALASSSATPPPIATRAPVAQDCHTHADGTVHCV